MDYNWIKTNFPEVFVKKGKMYIELDYGLYRALKDQAIELRNRRVKG